MSSPIALGGSALPLQQGSANALSAPTTPSRRLPVIDRSKVDPETLKAAEGMETMFLDYMLQEMRKTVPKNDMDLESPATEIYRGMLDQETAKNAAHAGGVGLADQIIAYLDSQRYTGPNGAQGVPSPARQPSTAKTVATNAAELSTGGTHAGQPDKQ